MVKRSHPVPSATVQKGADSLKPEHERQIRPRVRLSLEQPQAIWEKELAPVYELFEGCLGSGSRSTSYIFGVYALKRCLRRD